MTTEPDGDDERSDEALMGAHVRGEDGAFRELFERYAEPLQRMMRRGGVPRDAAPDLVQKTFLNLHRARRDFDTDKSLRSWLYTIALNIRREYFRRRGRSRETTVEEMPTSARGPVRIERFEDAQLLSVALDELTDTLRNVVELHWFEELTFREIADALDISRSAAKVRAHRAYKQMRGVLESKAPKS